jgi:hypothetical protein
VHGDTDSERFFALITRETRRAGGDLRAGITEAVGRIAERLLESGELLRVTPDLRCASTTIAVRPADPVARPRGCTRPKTCRRSRPNCAFHALTGDRAPTTVGRHACTRRTGGCVMKRLYAGALATIGMLLVLGPAAALSDGRTDVILAGSQDSVDYHAEAAPARPADGGATIIGGNIHIVSDRGVRGGTAGACDPDPRFGTHPRPDDQGCTWDEPVGAGRTSSPSGATSRTTPRSTTASCPTTPTRRRTARSRRSRPRRARASTAAAAWTRTALGSSRTARCSTTRT